ncbi:hypothetical protein [Veillonella sp.]|nr:hypothetical protein [Veillonella sp.]
MAKSVNCLAKEDVLLWFVKQSAMKLMAVPFTILLAITPIERMH